MSQPTVAELYDMFKKSLNNYILLAFEQNRYLRLRYQQLANAILNALIANVESKQASQRVLHKDVSVFTDYIDYAERSPPLPSISYTGPTMSVAGRTIPQIPVFQFTPPSVELETASLTVLANALIIQIDRTINADADYENSFYKYYTFEQIGVSPGGAFTPELNISDAPLTMGGRVVLSGSVPFSYDQRMTLTRIIYDKTTQGSILAVNAFLYIGSLKALLDVPGFATPQQIDLPAILTVFEAIGQISYFKGLRLMSTVCQGTAVAADRILGKLVILRKSGFAGSVYCQ